MVIRRVAPRRELGAIVGDPEGHLRGVDDQWGHLRPLYLRPAQERPNVILQKCGEFSSRRQPQKYLLATPDRFPATFRAVADTTGRQAGLSGLARDLRRQLLDG